jgi:hypothetical protein
MHENFTTCNRYIPSYQKYKFEFLSRYKVAKWGVNGNADFTVIGLTFRG